MKKCPINTYFFKVSYLLYMICQHQKGIFIDSNNVFSHKIPSMRTLKMNVNVMVFNVVLTSCWVFSHTLRRKINICVNSVFTLTCTNWCSTEVNDMLWSFHDTDCCITYKAIICFVRYPVISHEARWYCNESLPFDIFVETAGLVYTEKVWD